jgi:hypothetical protein
MLAYGKTWCEGKDWTPKAAPTEHPAVAALREAMRYCGSTKAMSELEAFRVPDDKWADWKRIVNSKQKG